MHDQLPCSNTPPLPVPTPVGLLVTVRSVYNLHCEQYTWNLCSQNTACKQLHIDIDASC